MKISSILAKKGGQVFSIGIEANVSGAIDALSEYNVGALVVLDNDGELVGIISERDIIRAAVRGRDIFSVPVAEVMTTEVIVGVPQDEVLSIAHIMTERRFRHLPIKDNDKLVGLVSIGDILKTQRDEFLGAIDTLEHQIMADDK